MENFQLPLPNTEWIPVGESWHPNMEIRMQIAFDRPLLQQQIEHNLPLLNTLQRAAYNSVIEAVNGEPSLFFLDGPGGTGKTFVENLLLATVWKTGGIALAVASSGIAAILLDSGRTAHSTFRIPIDIDLDSYCGVDIESPGAFLLQKVQLIIWDECSMQHRYCFEAVDMTLRDIRGNEQLPFGGVTVLFAGDFQQCLPVVPSGSRSQITSASLKASNLWNGITVLRLEENLRLLAGNLTVPQRVAAEEYADWILKIGEGRIRSETEESIEIPSNMRVQDNKLSQLIATIYPGIGESIVSPEYLSERAILAARNIDVDALNDEILDLLPGNERVYLSADSVSAEDEETYGPEILNALVVPG
jgi:hypothetical protein